MNSLNLNKTVTVQIPPSSNRSPRANRSPNFETEKVGQNSDSKKGVSELLPKKYINNTVIVFVGESHRDPAPIGLTRIYMEKFHSMGIPQIFCSELPCTQTIEIKGQYESTNAKNNDFMLKKITKLDTIAKKHPDLAFPYFTLNSRHDIKKVVAEAFPSMEESVYIQMSDYLTRYIYTIESLQLNQQLLNLGISFQGIERPEEEHKKWALNCVASNNLNVIVASAEQMRIQVMTENIFVRAFQQLEKSGGIIWVNLGVLHSHNLAVSVLNHIQKNDFTKKHSFTLIPTACFSLYSQDTKDSLMGGVLEARNNMDQKQLLPLFDKLSLQLVDDVKELGKHRYESLKFDALMRFVEKSLDKKNIFYIPSFNAQKKKVIEEKNGEIQRIEREHAVVSIASEVLLQPLRDQLGIERRKLTFSKNYANNIGKLCENPLITVEFLPDPQQVVATFPSSQLAQVTELIV